MKLWDSHKSLNLWNTYSFDYFKILIDLIYYDFICAYGMDLLNLKICLNFSNALLLLVEIIYVRVFLNYDMCTISGTQTFKYWYMKVT